MKNIILTTVCHFSIIFNQAEGFICEYSLKKRVLLSSSRSLTKVSQSASTIHPAIFFLFCRIWTVAAHVCKVELICPSSNANETHNECHSKLSPLADIRV